MLRNPEEGGITLTREETQALAELFRSGGNLDSQVRHLRHQARALSASEGSGGFDSQARALMRAVGHIVAAG